MQKIENVKFPFKLLVVIPALALGFLLWKYGVNCPFMDEWDTPGLDLVRFNLGELNFDRLIRQHNESRKFFPRLLFIYLSRSIWNPRIGMLFSLLLSCLTTFNIYYLSKLTLKDSAARTVCVILASMLIFSPMQWENWLWGLQMITFIPIAAITSALVIISTQTPLIVKLLASAGLATCATFSFANGIISWVVIFPALYLVASKSRRSLAMVSAGWLLFFSANVAVYFHDYHSPEHHPSFMDALVIPFQSIAYYLSFLGSPLGIHQLGLNQILGLGICLLIALSGLYLFFVNRHLFVRLLPWISILSYTLISGALTTAGRVGFGVEQSLVSRYVTFSTYGIVPLIYIMAIVVGDIKARSPKIKSIYDKLAKYIPRIALTVLILLYPLNFARGVRAMDVTHQDRLYGKSCLTLINIIPDRECITNQIYPNFENLFKRVNELDRVGLIQPSLILSDRLENISRDTYAQINYGSLESLTLTEDNNYLVSGWSILPQYNAPAHAVILAYQTEDKVNRMLAIAQPESTREDLRQKTKNYKNIGWSKTIAKELIPDDTVSITAWAFDSKLARAYRLEGIQLVK